MILVARTYLSLPARTRLTVGGTMITVVLVTWQERELNVNVYWDVDGTIVCVTMTHVVNREVVKTVNIQITVDGSLRYNVYLAIFCQALNNVMCNLVVYGLTTFVWMILVVVTILL
jgi:hypothetical protein